MKTITENTLIKRINRRLASDGEAVRVHLCKWNSRWFTDLGRYYLVDVNRNTIEGQHIDIEDLGREVGALGATEEVAV